MRHLKCRLFRRGGVEKWHGPCKFGPCGPPVKGPDCRHHGQDKHGHDHHGKHGRHYGYHRSEDHGYLDHHPRHHHSNPGHRGHHGPHHHRGHNRGSPSHHHGYHGSHGHHGALHLGPHGRYRPHELHGPHGPHGPHLHHPCNQRDQDKLRRRFKNLSKQELVMILIRAIEDADVTATEESKTDQERCKCTNEDEQQPSGQCDRGCQKCTNEDAEKEDACRQCDNSQEDSNDQETDQAGDEVMDLEQTPEGERYSETL